MPVSPRRIVQALVLPRDVLETRNGRLTAFSLLYLTEGIPFGFAAIALVTYLRQQGVGLTEIGVFTGMLYLPWGFKWVWAPFIDLIRPARLGPRRFWIVISQSFMIGTLLLIWFIKPGANLVLLTSLIFWHNAFASAQDVAIDALAVQVLPEHERGVANGFMFGASYLGQAIGGSGALWIAGRFGFQATFPFVCGVLAVILFTVSIRLVEPPLQAVEQASRAAGVLREVVRRVGKYLLDLVRGFFLSGMGPTVGVIFGLMPFGALALGLALGATMQVDLGMDENQIATLTLWGTVASALGCVIGGWVSDRLGHRKMLATWFALTVLPTFYLSGQFTGASGMDGVTMESYFVVAVVYAFMSGLISGTSAAVFMGLTSPIVAATQFSGYMALRNLVYTYSANWQGQAADAIGYAKTLRLDAWIALVPILAILFLKPAKPEPLQGGPAARRLRVWAVVFTLATPIALLFAGDWRAPDPATQVMGLLALVLLGGILRGVSRDLAFRLAVPIAVAGVALFVARYVDGREWARFTQLTLAGALSALVALGMLAVARYEARKAERMGATS